LAATPKAELAKERRALAQRRAEANRNNRKTCCRQEVLYGISNTQSWQVLKALRRVWAVPEEEAAERPGAGAERPGAEAELPAWPPLARACRSGYRLLPACSGWASRRMNIGYTLLFLRLSVDRP
jgi:hypothetical protein